MSVPGSEDLRRHVLRASRHKLGRGNARSFLNRDAWLAERSGHIAAGGERLCVAMYKLARRRAPSSPGNLVSGWPWFTPVLGSGCLESGVPAGMDAASLAAAAAAGLPDPTKSDNSDGLNYGQGEEAAARFEQDQDAARRYVDSLASSRLSASDHGTGLGAGEVSPPVALLVLAAAKTTACFHQLQDLNNKAFGRWEEDIAELSVDTTGSDTRLDALKRTTAEVERLSGYLDAAISGLVSMGSEVFTKRTVAVLADLKEDLRAERSPAQITLRHARLLSELAWYHLTREQEIYPGWSDLLLRMVLETDGGDDEADSFSRYRQLRPRFMYTNQLEEAVRSLYAKPSKASIDDRQSGDRAEFYDAVASVLWAQASNTGAEEVASPSSASDPDEPTIGGVRTPQPSAFMTSFDLELPAALWRMGNDGSRFSIAMPIYVQPDDAGDEVEAAWVLARYTVRRSLSRELTEVLQEPVEFVVGHPNLDLDPREPVVVYLSGCPLVRLPTPGGDRTDAFQDLCDDLERTARITRVPGQTSFHHTVIIDEYLAARRSAAELFWLSDPGTGYEWSRSLPVKLFSDQAANQRFWMAFGVPIADPAIRTILTTRMTMRSLHESAGSGTEGPEGVVVGRRIDDEEASVLHWFGFDVVRQTQCTEFTEDLRHWYQHLADPSNGIRIATNGCNLDRKHG